MQQLHQWRPNMWSLLSPHNRFSHGCVTYTAVQVVVCKLLAKFDNLLAKFMLQIFCFVCITWARQEPRVSRFVRPTGVVRLYSSCVYIVNLDCLIESRYCCISIAACLPAHKHQEVVACDTCQDIFQIFLMGATTARVSRFVRLTGVVRFYCMYVCT